MKFILFGSLPPPIGGVSKSIENLLHALKSRNIEAELFSKRVLFKRYDIAHIHYSKSWKRLLGLIIGKLIAKKVIFTLHGNHYRSDLFNNISAKLTDGVILLNKTTAKKLEKKFKRITILSSIFLEGFQKKDIIKKHYIDRKEGKVYLLVYAYGKVFQEGKDIYGIDFLLNNFISFNNKYVLVLVDPQGDYKNDVVKLNTNNLMHIDYEVDFVSLLQEIDIYLRPTITDGSSVAVQEALLSNKYIVASNVVERPNGVTTYIRGDFLDFYDKLNHFKHNSNNFSPDSVKDYINFSKLCVENR